jgi:hypothetical protein
MTTVFVWFNDSITLVNSLENRDVLLPFLSVADAGQYAPTAPGISGERFGTRHRQQAHKMPSDRP